MAERYAPVLMTDEETVVASYEPLPPTTGKRQTEAELESDFVERLVSQGYERTVLKNERELLDNLRTQLETMNGFGFSDSEWERFRDEVLCNPNLKTEDKTELIQRENVQPMKLDDGTSRNVLLIDKKNPLRNRLQVMRQYSDRRTRNDDRYDVTILVNGLPLVHTELKRRGKSLKDAFYQIERYGKESFCEGSALFEFVQIFVISNGTETKYYSNTTRRSHVDNRGGNKSREAIGNWKFASWWTDARNRPILNLENFARTFFARRTILNILTKYCVFTADRRLLVMRPYQISAAERFVARARTAIENGLLGTQDANAFMWGATGCGKTLTSYKTSQLLSDLLGLDAVLFTVDRADLDNQTRAEYENCQPGCVDGNKSTKVLERQLGEIAEHGTTANGNDMIVTTIQKLSRFVKNNPKHPIYDKKVAILFDECHRSQFGEMRRAISKAFRKSCMFGFTGTPIFAENAGTGRNAKATTTAQLFGGPKVVDENGVERILPLQTYTMVDSIRDGNTLPFMIEYWDTLGKARNGTDEKVIDIDRDTAWEAPERISLVTSTILDQFDAKTKRGVRTKSGYSGDKMNGMLCCGSVNGAMKYHAEFERQIAERGLDLKVAVIYTSPTGEGPADGFDCGLIDDEPLTTEGMPENARKYLERAIERYSAAFSKQVDMKSPDGFENYYEDVSQKMKSGELDLLIVVNMFLTGFDSARLNTLWVDKNLRMHGLIQAF